MAKTKAKSHEGRRQRKKGVGLRTSSNPFASTTQEPADPEESLESLISTVSGLLRNDCSPPAALSVVERALKLSPTSLPALELAAEIYVELGDVSTARSYFEKAVRVDPDGMHEDAGGSGPEKFLWLAQLCENGGAEAVAWYERGVKVLRAWITEYESTRRKMEMLEERGLKGKLCSALCGMAEIYMTDLWYGRFCRAGRDRGFVFAW